MATTKTNQFEVIDGTTVDKLDPIDLEGRIRVAFFSHTCESEASGSTIKLTKVPAGARVLAIAFASEDCGNAGATIEIGDSGDTDRLVSAFDIGTAAVAYSFRAMRTPTTETPDIGFGYQYTSATEITATTAVDALNTNNFWGAIFYVVD